jgi:hypothetical protein
MAGVTLLIRKLPNNTSVEDVKKFIKTGVTWRYKLFLKFTRISTLTVIDKITMDTELQFIVTIEPDVAGNNIIKRLHAKHLNGRRVVVKPYYQRNPKNDRRKAPDASGQDLEKRANDRRRREIVTFDDQSTKVFSRKLI